jgi:hypothetical protein
MSQELNPEQIEQMAHDFEVMDSHLLNTRAVLARARALLDSMMKRHQANARGALNTLLRDDDKVRLLAQEWKTTEEEVRRSLQAPKEPTVQTIMDQQEAADAISKQHDEYEEAAQLYAYSLPAEQRKKVAAYVAAATAELLLEKKLKEQSLEPETVDALRKVLIRNIKETLLNPMRDEPL